MPSNDYSRRQLLGVGASLALVPSIVLANTAKPKRVQRVAHLTDIHVQPENSAPDGMAKAIEQALSHKPDMILGGGDCVMDCFSRDEARTKAQWDIYKSVLSGLKIPLHQAIGNHDIWGWNKASSGTTGNEPKWGKRWALEVFERDTPYYSFDQKGWHFVVLDSTFPVGGGYIAKFDDQQFEWLESDLASTKLPTLILTHQPLLSVCAYLDGDNETSGNWHVPGAWMHIDFRRVKDLFKKHAHVKVCLSGHIHLADRTEYLGVTYLCNGAVSGGWWGGNYQEFPPLYAMIDLFDDGSFSCETHDYGWKAK